MRQHKIQSVQWKNSGYPELVYLLKGLVVKMLCFSWLFDTGGHEQSKSGSNQTMDNKTSNRNPWI